jgi:hypothetical protein
MEVADLDVVWDAEAACILAFPKKPDMTVCGYAQEMLGCAQEKFRAIRYNSKKRIKLFASNSS